MNNNKQNSKEMRGNEKKYKKEIGISYPNIHTYVNNEGKILKWKFNQAHKVYKI